jgi:RND family efflux transporter MFP subunit
MKNLIIILSFLAFCACNAKTKPKEDENLTPTTKKANEITPIRVISVQQKPFDYQIQANGKVDAKDYAELRFKYGGYLKEIFVQNGQSVSAGQILASLETIDQDLALKKAKNLRAIAQEDYIKELTEFGGNPSLPDGGIKPELNERIKIRKNLKTYDLQIEEAENSLKFSQLKSPFAGIIADMQLKKGNFITPNQVACVVYSAGNLEVVADVLETELPFLKIGQEAHIKAIGKDEKNALAYISDINPKINTNGLLKVKLRLANPKGFFVGMNVSAMILVPQKITLAVPREAIVVRSGKKVVFAYEDGLAKWHYVETGLENAQEIEIIKGIKAGEKIIIKNNLQLAHDSAVKLEK